MDIMSDTIQNSVTDLKMAYRLLLHSRVLEARNKGDKVGEKAALAELEKDGAEISEGAKAAQSASVSAGGDSSDLNTNINLSALIQKLHNSGGQNQQGQTAQVVALEESIEIEESLTYYNLEQIDGLVVKNRNLAETDRYRFEFSDGSTFKITDKWSNRSTTIWGDPHVDTSDEEGNNNGDFKDLSGSDQYTTFMLSDGTRLTFTARDNGIIEKVDIFNGSQHLTGIGAASKEWNEKDGLFAKSVKNDAISSSSLVPMGDVVYAGGDGNDWYDASRNLIWGKTTGLIVTSRPSSYVEYTYSQRITQQLTVLQVDQQA
jgi:hypothetical protein